jgi:beta-phosphoglucomutase family hydrolase
MPTRGVIFDLNGTLVDDIGYHFMAWRELGASLGMQLDDATLQSFNGLKNEDIIPRLLGRPALREEFDRLTSFKEERYRALYRPHLAPLAGAEALLSELGARGVRCAIASSAPPANRDMVVDGLGWRATFAAIVEAERLPGKPAPDVFLEAARKLAVPPSECVVFEDAVHGVHAGVAAGMVVVAITTTVPAETLLSAGAKWAAADFDQLPEDVLALLTG